MATKKKTGVSGLDRERVRRRRLEQAKAEGGRGQALEDDAPSDDPQLATGGAPAPPARTQGAVVATGPRQLDQQVTCVWCGGSVTVEARGPLP